MNKHSSERIRSIAARAMDIDPGQREAFIASACDQNPEAIRKVVEEIRLAQVDTVADSTKTLAPDGDHGNGHGEHCFATGQVIDKRFQIIESISEGGMGEVYSALELNLREKVALKAIRSNIAALSGIIERFKAEVKQSLRITHPNVCRVYQLASGQGRDGSQVWFLTMELLPGPTLAHYLAEHGPMPFDRAQVLIRQMVSGLACAHQAGIIHRDLKPSNLMLVGSGTNERLVITDFGLAVSVSTREAGRIFGTPAYMAPEQASGGSVGPQSDLFSLGLIICEMLTGKLPALDLTSEENCTLRLKSWFSQNPKVPAQILPVIKRCLQFRPGDRYTDAREIVPLLESKRRITAERLAVAGILIAASVALIALLLPPLAGRVVNLYQVTPDNTVSALPSLSADGKHLAYMSNRADASNLDVWYQSTPAGDPRRLTKNSAEDTSPNLSADGKWVAFRSERNGGGIYLIGADGNGERLLVQGGRNPAFSPDGKAVAYWQGSEDAPRSGELYLYPLDKGSPQRLVANFDDARHPTWNADGQLLFLGCRDAVAEARSCPDWWVVDPNGGEPTNTGLLALLRSQHIEPDTIPHVSPRGDHVFISGRNGPTYHIWDILLSGANPRVIGRPLQVTFGDQDERAVTVAENGTLALEHVSGALHLWRISVAGVGNSDSAPQKLTDRVEPDCCPAVTPDGHWLFFTRRIADFRQLMRLDLSSGQQSTVYTSNEDKLWPLPNSSGDLVAFEARSGNQSSIVLWKPDGVRILCNACFHPGAWISDGRELLYTTSDGGIGILNILSGESRTVISANRDYVVSYSDWNPRNQHLLFTATQGGIKRIFAARLAQEGTVKAVDWMPVTSPAETADLARWSAEGNKVFYFSHKDGFYCLWENSFDSERQTIGIASPLTHYHDWGKGASRTAHYVLGMSVAGNSIYTNIGEVSATVWEGHVQRNPIGDFIRKTFEH
jgi:eukaryotic-like serine/threonine-protein kinase